MKGDYNEKEKQFLYHWYFGNIISYFIRDKCFFLIQNTKQVDFNEELVGIWHDGNNEILISEDGSYVWTHYTINENRGRSYIYTCSKGYINDDVMISTSEYQKSKIEGNSVTNKDTHYYSYEDIPLDEWETGQKREDIK